jgi:hypothetical protein
MIVALLIVVSIAVYYPALSAAFFDDDYQWLVSSWSFHPGQLVAFGSMSHFYRPVIDTYFGVLTPLLGGSPLLFHAASIGIHVANVLVVFALAARIGGDRLYGFATALLFAVQPSDIDAIAWVGALAEAIGAFFGCLSLLWFLRWRDRHEPRFRVLSVIAFALALLTHESSVMFLPVLVLMDYLLLWRVQEDPPFTPQSRAAAFVPFIALTVVYLGIDLWINSRNYVISQGHYTFGWHVVTNALNYITALYVGRRDVLNYVLIAIGLGSLLAFGSRRVRFATCWMLLALAPFLLFNWGNTSRYLYQPAIGFSLLVAEAVRKIDRRVAVIVIAVVAIRFGLFAHANVRDFSMRSQVYPEYLARFRQVYGGVPPNTTLTLDARLATKMPYQFVNAAVQWEYKDPTIRLTPYE